jgi:hypothetical protein
MYKRKMTEEERDAIRRGDTRVLKSVLQDVDKILVKELKKQKGDLSFQQGASFIIDALLELISAP